jgi:hypothetical protein
MTLVKALEKFNRKERYWLIRSALGESSEKLDSKFCDLIYGKHSIEVPEDAWWAMDYHLDWLVVKAEKNHMRNNTTQNHTWSMAPNWMLT